MRTRLSPASVSLLFLFLLLSACGTPSPQPAASTPTPSASTGLPELDSIVATTLSGDVDELRALLGYTMLRCTLAQGLGGPPRCAAGEPEGTPVEVLPLLGPEGTFIRRADIDEWAGLQVSDFLAAYEVSPAAFSDQSYPAGEYALVFEGAPQRPTTITLQIRQGRIVRIDYGMGEARGIRAENVERFLVHPDGAEP